MDFINYSTAGGSSRAVHKFFGCDMVMLFSNDWWIVQSKSWSQACSWRFCVGAPSKVLRHKCTVTVKLLNLVKLTIYVSSTLTRDSLLVLPGQ